LNKDLTDFYQEQIQQAIQKFNTRTQKYLRTVKPIVPKFKVCIKTHKENEPIRPVVNNKQVPSYKNSKYLNKKLNNLIYLPYTFTTNNSQEIAQELNNIQLNKHNKIVP
jgi:hypothetical protein